jgi:hypothetical protein
VSDGVGAPWPTDPRQVQRQDDVLQSIVQPALIGRQWFFRRRALGDGDTREHNDTIILMVRLQAITDTPSRALSAVSAALQAAGHRVTEVAEWDGNPGHRDRWDYDLEVNAQWREFCCSVARAYLERASRADARCMARRWLDALPPWSERLVHWFCWITGDPDKRARLAEFDVY